MPQSDGSIVIDTKILEDGFKKGIGSLASLSKRAGVAIGAGIGVATAALFGFAVASMKAAEGDRQGAQRLQQIGQQMGRTKGEAAALTDRLTKLADQQALATGVDDGAIKATQAKLLTFKELGKTADEVGGHFDRATMAAVDLAAAGFGSAESNAVQLGKALQDPIKGVTALGRAGVTFTATEKAKMKALTESGHIEQAQEIMLKAIETQVGGTAAASATATQKMGIAFDQLKQNAGAALLPIADTMLPAVVDATKTLTPQLTQAFGGLSALLTGGDMTAGAADLAAGISAMGSSLVSGVTKILPGLITALTVTITAMAKAIGPLLPPLATAFLQGLAQLATALPAILPPIISGLSGVIVAVAAALPSILTGLLNGFVAGLLAIMAALPVIIPALIGALTGIISQVATLLPTILPLLLNGFVALLLAVVTMLPVVIPMLLNAFVGLITSLATLLPTILPVLLNGFISLITAVLNALPIIIPALIMAFVDIIVALATAIPAMLPQIIGAILRLIPMLLNMAPKLVVAIVTGLVKAIPKLAVAALKLVVGIVTAIVDAIPKVLAVGGQIVDGMRQGISNAWSNMVSWFSGLFGDLIGIAKRILGIASPSKVFTEIAGNVVKGFSNGIASNAAGITGAFDSLDTVVADQMDKLGATGTSKTFDATLGINAKLPAGIGSAVSAMKRSVSAEMARFSGAVVPRAAAAVVGGGDTFHVQIVAPTGYDEDAIYGGVETMLTSTSRTARVIRLSEGVPA